MARRAAKRDGNEPAIVAALEAIGAGIGYWNGTDKAPDLIIGWRKVNYLIEIKNPEHYGKLSEGQKEWHEDWPGQVATARTIDEVLRIIGAIE